MDRLFKESGCPNIHIRTVEGDFSLETFLEELRTIHPAHVHLAPFMIVAGDHASNDMAGEDEDSWKSILEKEGFQISCTLQGLGELPSIRDIFLRHVRSRICTADPLIPAIRDCCNFLYQKTANTILHPLTVM